VEAAVGERRGVMAARKKKLTYWVAPHLTDSRVYNIRARTKRDALAMLAEYDPGQYGPVQKVTVEYYDPFDLVTAALSEGGAYWEPWD
jgi:hypothetical protein